MHPVLLTVGGFPLFSYGVMGALGFLVVALVVLRRSRALFLNLDRVADVVVWTSVAALVGARGLFLLQNPVGSLGEAVNIRGGGLVFYGALLVGLPVAALLVRRHRIPLLPFLDVVATALPLGHAVSRLGCFLAGCCYGRPVSWGVVFHHPLSDAPTGTPLHPTQLYEAIGLLAIGAVLHLAYRRRRFDGQVLLLYLVSYAALRSVVEVFRGDLTRGFLVEGWVSFSQGVSVLVAVAALALMAAGARRSPCS